MSAPPATLLAHNPNLSRLETDHLYHLGLDSSMDLPAMFGDVKFVVMGGSAVRMHDFIENVLRKEGEALGLSVPVGQRLAPIGKTERFELYKLGPVLSVSHGMGMPSMSVLLHEITKLLRYAGASNFAYIRMGTSGGLGLEPGTVVLCRDAVSSAGKPVHTLRVLGEERHYPTRCHAGLREGILASCAARGIATAVGNTMGCDGFYEEQARTDGCFCDYSVDDRLAYLGRLHDDGVRNIEMESTYMSAFCLRAGVPAAIACVTLVDRLRGDQIDSTKEQLAAYVDSVQDAVIAFIRDRADAGYPEFKREE